MGHYDDCRPNYCSICGAAPGNIINGICNCCDSIGQIFSKKEIMHDKNHCSNCGYGPTKRLVNGRCAACPPLEVMREKIKAPIKNRKENQKLSHQEFMEAFDEYMRNYNASEDKVWYKKGKQRNWSDFPVEEK